MVPDVFTVTVVVTGMVTATVVVTMLDGGTVKAAGLYGADHTSYHDCSHHYAG